MDNDLFVEKMSKIHKDLRAKVIEFFMYGEISLFFMILTEYMSKLAKLNDPEELEIFLKSMITGAELSGLNNVDMMKKGMEFIEEGKKEEEKDI